MSMRKYCNRYLNLLLGNLEVYHDVWKHVAEVTRDTVSFGVQYVLLTAYVIPVHLDK